MCSVNLINDICAANKLRCIVFLPIPAPSRPLCHSNALGTDFLFNSPLSYPGSPLHFPSLFLFRVYYTAPPYNSLDTCSFAAGVRRCSCRRILCTGSSAACAHIPFCLTVEGFGDSAKTWRNMSSAPGSLYLRCSGAPHTQLRAPPALSSCSQRPHGHASACNAWANISSVSFVMM